MPQNKEQSTLQLRKIQKQNSRKLLQILLVIGILLSIVIALFVWASIRLGGFQNIFKGNGNVVTNTVTNIGDAISSTATPTPTPTVFTITNNIADPNKLSEERPVNSIVFVTNIENYQVTVTRNSTIQFVNQTGKSIGLQFSDGRQIRLNPLDSNSANFYYTGTISFVDQIDSSQNQITGTITVIN